MATVTARKVDDVDYAILAEIAEEHGRSVSEELRLMIADRARQRRANIRIAEMVATRDRANLKLPSGRTSLDLLRAERDS